MTTDFILTNEKDERDIMRYPKTRECVNCRHSRGLGSDVWCGHDPKGKESYMCETDCPYFEWFEYKE